MDAAGAFLRAISRLLLLAAWLVLSLLQQLIGFALRTGDGRHLRRRFYRGALRILGIRIRVYGTLSVRRPLFVVANHASYLDIFVLGSVLPSVFVSKQEVRRWPVIGSVASLQQTIFIARNPRAPADEIKPIVDALNAGHNVTVFPEGTSTDGRSVLPFKSPLFDAAKTANAFIQPIGLVYRERHGGVISQKDRDFYTWGTDAPFFTHFLRLILRPGVLVEVWIRPHLAPDLGRKELASIACRRVKSPIRHRATG